MKILFILELYYPNIGGIERLFKGLADELAAQGHGVTVITTRFRHDLPGRETINGVQVKRLRIRSRFLFTYFGVTGMLAEARKADLIHTTSYNAAFPARLAGWIMRKKVVITFHEAWGRLWFSMPFTNPVRKCLYYAYERFILRLGFYRYVAVSDHTAERLVHLGVNKNKVTRIYNGLDYSMFGKTAIPPPPDFIFTYFGRLGISKGLDLIMRAAPVFLRRHPEACFRMIVPDRPASLLRQIKKTFRDFSTEQFSLLHHLSDQQLRQELCNSSCTLIPSYNEGFCFAAAESIALGIPVVSSGRGALKEVLSGRFITMETFDPEGLLHALEMAKNNAWTETPVRYFHFADTINNYMRLYGEILTTQTEL